MDEVVALVDKLVSDKFGAGRWVANEFYSEFYFRGSVFEKIAADAELLASIKTAVARAARHRACVRSHAKCPAWPPATIRSLARALPQASSRPAAAI